MFNVTVLIIPIRWKQQPQQFIYTYIYTHIHTSEKTDIYVIIILSNGSYYVNDNKKGAY